MLIRIFVCKGVKTCSEAAEQISSLEDVLKAEVTPVLYISIVLIFHEKEENGKEHASCGTFLYIRYIEERRLLQFLHASISVSFCYMFILDNASCVLRNLIKNGGDVRAGLHIKR